MKYSEQQLIQFAHNNPQELIKIINNSHNNVKVLIDAIEILGSEVTDETVVLPLLQKLLKHINVMVREGALIGISSYYGTSEKRLAPDILDKLSDISINDPAPLLREYAKDLLLKFK